MKRPVSCKLCLQYLHSKIEMGASFWLLCTFFRPRKWAKLERPLERPTFHRHCLLDFNSRDLKGKIMVGWHKIRQKVDQERANFHLGCFQPRITQQALPNKNYWVWAMPRRAIIIAINCSGFGDHAYTRALYSREGLYTTSSFRKFHSDHLEYLFWSHISRNLSSTETKQWILLKSLHIQLPNIKFEIILTG